MSRTLEQVKSDALSLPPEEQRVLIDTLQASRQEVELEQTLQSRSEGPFTELNSEAKREDFYAGILQKFASRHGLG